MIILRPVLLMMVLPVYFSLHAQDEYVVKTVVQKGHSGVINVMKFSRDGRFMVTGSEDQSLKLWDVKSGREIRTFKGHQEAIQDLDLNIEKGLIVSSAGTASGSEIKVWDIYSGEPKKTVKGGEPLNLFNIDAMEWAYEIRTMALAPDAETLLWGEDNLGIQKGKITRRRSNDLIETDWEPNSIVFSPDGKYFAAGGDAFNRRVDGRSDEIRIYTYPAMELYKTIHTPNDNINKLIYSSDGDLLACLNTQLVWEGQPVMTGGFPITKKRYNNRITVYDLITDNVVFEVEKEGWELRELAFSPNGQLLAFPMSTYDTLAFSKWNYRENDKIMIYDINKKVLGDSIDSGEFLIHSMGFTPDGQVLVANGNNINYWSVAGKELIRKIVPPRKIEDFSISNEGVLHATKLVGNQKLHFSLDPQTLDFSSYEFPADQFYHFVNEAFYITIEKGQMLMRSHHDLVKPKLLFDFKNVPGWDFATEVELSPGMDYLVCRNSDQKEILVCDLKTGSGPKLWKGHRKKITSMKVSPDGSLLATGSDGNKIIVWDLKSGAIQHELLGHNGDILSLSFHPESNILASGSADASVKLWDLKKGSRIHTFLGHTSDVLSLDFNDDGTRLVSGSGDPLFGGKSEIRIWDVKRERKLEILDGNEGYTSGLVYQNRRIYSIGLDPVIKVFEEDDFNIIYSYIPINEKDYILFTPDNYYMSTKMNYPVVHFIKGLDIYSFDNFDLQYNRPDIILKRLGSTNEKLINAYGSIYQKRLKKLGFDESMFSHEFHLPEVLVKNREKLPVVSNSKELTFSLEVRDELLPLVSLQVWVNNVPIYGSSRLNITNETQPYGKDGSYLDKTVTVALNQGVNRIQVSVLNTDGVESHREGFEVLYPGTKEGKADLYLLAVSVSNYKDPAMNLNYAEKDGRDMVNFISQNQKIYDKVHVKTLFNENATRENFLSLKDQLYTSNVDDQVILFMSGHGLLDESLNFNFASYDLDFRDPARNGISYDMIESIMDSIPARQKLILIDACHSGEVDKIEIEEKAQEIIDSRGVVGELKSQSFDQLKMNVFRFYGVNNNSVEMMEQLFTNLSNESGSIVISAAAGNSYALESSDWNNGVFTFSVLEGLKNSRADNNHDQRVTVTELKDYVVDRVFNLTRGKQKPTSRKENLEFDFTVWK